MTGQTLYEQRENRINTAIGLGRPDRVPFVPFVGMYPFQLSALSAKEAYADFQKATDSWVDFLAGAPLIDALFGYHTILPIPSAVKKILDYRLVQYPGMELPDNQSFQFVEKEYLKLADYEAFLHNPGDWLYRRMLPQVGGAFQGLAKLPPFDTVARGYQAMGGLVSAFADDEIWKTVTTLREAGLEQLKANAVIGAFLARVTEMGFPNIAQGTITAPFDVISDQLRGTIGAMKDTLRHPDKILAACDWAEGYQKNMIDFFKQIGAKCLFYPLHKGIDGFMSEAQFRKFYWPSLESCLKYAASRGLVNFVLLEDAFDTRLEIIKDAAPGQIIYMCEKTDVTKAKKIMGQYACIMGGLPISLLMTGRPAQIRDQVKKVLDEAAADGGFIMSNSTSIDWCPQANVEAYFQAVEDFGKY